MRTILNLVLLSCLVLLPFGLNVYCQAIKIDDPAQGQPQIRYTFLSQRWLTKEELSRFKDVHGLSVAVRVRFSNEGKEHVYYLAGHGGSIIPHGYRLSRKTGESKWQYLPRSRGREGLPGSEFVGVAYKWLELPPGASIEFEVNNWNNDQEEYAFSTFVRKDQDSRPVEITSEAFGPISKERVSLP